MPTDYFHNYILVLLTEWCIRNVSIHAVLGLISSPILLGTDAIIFQPDEPIYITCPGDIHHENDITWSIDDSIYEYRSNEIDGVTIVSHSTSSDSIAVNFVLKFSESKNGSILRCCYISTRCNESIKSYKLLLKSPIKEGK